MTFNLHANLTIADLVALLSPADREFLQQFVKELQHYLEPFIFMAEFFDAASLGELIEVQIRFNALMVDYLPRQGDLNQFLQHWQAKTPADVVQILNRINLQGSLEKLKYISSVSGYLRHFHRRTPVIRDQDLDFELSSQDVYVCVEELVSRANCLAEALAIA